MGSDADLHERLRAAEFLSSGMERLLQVSTALSRTHRPEEVVEIVLQQGLAAVGTSNGTVRLLSQDGGSLEMAGAVGLPREIWQSVPSMPLGADYPVTACFRAAAPVWIETAGDIAAHADAGKLVHEWSERIQAMGLVPLAIDGRCFGVLTKCCAEPHRFDELERRFMIILAQQCAQALDRAWLFEREKKARVAAEAERELALRTFAQAPVSISVYEGPDHIIRMQNAKFVETFGRHEGLGRPLREAVAEAGPLGIIERMDHTYRTGEAHEFVEFAYPMTDPDTGVLEERFFNTTIQAVRDVDGQVSGIIGAGVDVTEQVNARQRAEEASRVTEETNRMKEALLTQISHELRAPLAALLMWLDVMKNDSLDPARRKRAMTALRECAAAQSRLVQDLFDAARGRTGKLDLDVEPVDLQSLVESTVAGAEAAAGARSIGLHLLLEPSPALVRGDAQRLQQVFANVLGNAIRFTPQGGRVDVVVRRTEERVQVVFSDNGRGILAAFLPHIFEPFSQEDRFLGKPHGGLGLGLAIAKQLTELHGGSIEAASPGEGQGATFTVTLPRVPG